MIKNRCITMLKEIQEKNGFSRTKMAAMLDVSVESYSRWVKGISKPNQAIVLNRIANVLEEYKPS